MDFVYGIAGGVFMVDVPNGLYRVTVIVGDKAYQHDDVSQYAAAYCPARLMRRSWGDRKAFSTTHRL